LLLLFRFTSTAWPGHSSSFFFSSSLLQTALSNQKFRDLQEEFTHVGLMTGDITINPDATCLVMTTEILRSMLYRGSEIMREVAWVVYDEVHYMRDTERGVVWEESIILLPHQVKFVFLSATIPNASQFADWIADVHHQPCHVVYTNYRPTPLQHYIFPQGGDGLHLVVDEKGKFRQQNFLRAMATLQSSTMDGAAAEAMMDSGNGKKQKNAKSSKKKGGNSPFKDLFRIVKLVVERNLNPVIVFSFSKKDCERYALALHQEDYTDDVEKDLVSQVYKNAIEALSQDDCKLPQVVALLPLLKRGIGIHHAGLLPILKEIVEILFAEGLVKILFATETFAIGINMPAKTVVFTNTRKWDGKEMRYVTSGEYIQMSGRAGRRGKDDRGIVIQMVDEKMEPDICKDILYGAPDPLNSSYRISYNMLLNLMRVEDVDPEYLLRASFHQFQREAEAPALLAEAESMETQAAQVEFPTSQLAELAAQYYQMDKQLAATRRRIAVTVQRPEYCQRFLQAGRFLDVAIDGVAFGWGVVVSCRKKSGIGSAGNAGRLATQALAGSSLFTLDVLLNCVDRHFDDDSKNAKSDKSKTEDAENANLLWRGSVDSCRPVGADDDKKVVSMRVFTVDLDAMEKLSAVRIFIPQDVTTPEARRKVAISVQEVHKRFPDGLPLLDPVVDLGINDDSFRTLLRQAEALTTRLASHALSTDSSPEDRVAVVQAFGKKNDLLERAKVLRQEARSCQTIAMKDDLKKMKRVLKRLGHVNANGVLQTKGRTACEINTAHELVVVELIFTGVFNGISVEQCVALMSCMTFDEKSRDDDDPATGLKSHLLNPFLKLKECARSVVRVEIACGVDVKEDEFVDKFNPGMYVLLFVLFEFSHLP
jgi:ATP-dependent RNA helicase DOB1